LEQLVKIRFDAFNDKFNTRLDCFGEKFQQFNNRLNECGHKIAVEEKK